MEEDAQSDGISEEDEPEILLTNAIRSPPFPFTLESTWFLVAAWLLLGATNAYVQFDLEPYLGLGLILLKALATVVCAGAATAFYDTILTLVDEQRIWTNRDVELFLASLVARHWRIAINEDATLEDQKEALMQDGTLQVPRTVFSVVSELATWAVDCTLVLAYHVSLWHLLAGLIWMLRMFLGLPGILINATLLAGLLLCGRWVADTGLGRILRLRSACDKTQLSIASCLKSALALLNLHLSSHTIEQLTFLMICAVLAATSWALPTDIIMPFAAQDVNTLAGYVDILKTFVHEKSNALFSLKFGGSWSSVGQLGAQVGLQLCFASVCFLVVLVYHYLCQEEILATKHQVRRGELEFNKVGEYERCVAAVWRAAALHSISFTAYQVAGFAVSALELEPLLRPAAAPPAPSLWGALRSGEDLAAAAHGAGVRGLASLGTGVGIYAIHWVLRQVAWVFIRILTSTAAFEDAVMWSSRLTDTAVVGLKRHCLGIVRADFKLTDKVLLAQGLMHSLFDIRGPLVIVPPNHSIHAFDPEAWAP